MEKRINIVEDVLNVLLFEKLLKFYHRADIQISYFELCISDQIVFPGITDLVIGFRISEFSSF